jgi:hypothetical protein
MLVNQLGHTPVNFIRANSLLHFPFLQQHQNLTMKPGKVQQLSNVKIIVSPLSSSVTVWNIVFQMVLMKLIAKV